MKSSLESVVISSYSKLWLLFSLIIAYETWSQPNLLENGEEFGFVILLLIFVKDYSSSIVGLWSQLV